MVTGGSRGIGLETARQLIAEGANVLLVARHEDALRDAVAACASRDGEPAGRGAAAGRGEAAWLGLDITDPEAAERAAAECVARFGSFDVLVNNAGGSVSRSLPDLTDQDWRWDWEINVMAPMRLMRAAVPRMARRGWGRVVNVSSSSGKRPGQRNASYAVAKSAQLSLSRAYADFYARHGVLINAVTPGPVAGELWLEPGGLADQAARMRQTTREEVLRDMAAALPIGRLATPREIASVIVFLCSERASNVTGAAWSVDGGAVPVII